MIARKAERQLGPAGAAFLFACSLVLLGGCKKETRTVCHVGGTMRPVMQELAKLYESQGGEEVEINSAGSGELLAHIESHSQGDLYVCHDPFLDILMKRDLGVDGWTVAELTPVIVVQKGNKSIKGLADVAKAEVSLVLTDYEKSTLGHLLETMFTKAGVDFEKLTKQRNIQTFRKGGQAANMVKMKNADAAIVWNAVAHLRRNALDIVVIPPEHLPTPYVDSVTTATAKKEVYYLAPVRVTVATLKCSKRPKAAEKFARFLISPEATEVFKRFGYTMPDQTKMEYRQGKKLHEMSDDGKGTYR